MNSPDFLYSMWLEELFSKLRKDLNLCGKDKNHKNMGVKEKE